MLIFLSLGIILFAGNDIGDTGAIALAASIPNCSSLRHLLLERNFIVFIFLSLDIIIFIGNKIGDAGASTLADVLPKSYLLNLALAGNFGLMLIFHYLFVKFYLQTI